MNTLVSFVVSLYLRKAIIIWWDSIHQEFYRLWNIAENLCMRTAIYFPTTSNLDIESRQLVFRYCLLSIALFFKVMGYRFVNDLTDLRYLDIYNNDCERGAS